MTATLTQQTLILSAVNLGTSHMVCPQHSKGITNTKFQVSVCFLYPGAIVHRNYPYTENDTFMVHDFRCSAFATNTSECNIQYFTDSVLCGQNIAGVQCEGISLYFVNETLD